MKICKSLFLFIMIITICFIISSCLSDSYTHEEFLIKVDSIHLADTTTSNTPFDIEFFGTIGWDGCYSFSGFNQTFNNNDIIIEALGSYDNKDRKCPSVMVSLDGHKLNATIPHPGIYNIKVAQPDNSSLVKQITVN
jgi:hypothetical protein